MPSPPKPWPITLKMIPLPTHAGDVATPTKRWAGIPTHVRFRKLLKVMLRGYGMRVVDIRSHHPDFAPPPPCDGEIEPVRREKPKKRPRKTPPAPATIETAAT